MRAAERDVDLPSARLFSCHHPLTEARCAPGPIARILLNLALEAGLMKTVRDAAPTLSPKENQSTTFDNISKIDRIVTKFADIKLKGL